MCLTAWCAWLSPLVAAPAALAVLSPVSDLYCWQQGGTSATPRLAEPPALPVAPLSELEIAEQTVKVISLLQLCPRLGSAKVRLHSHDIVLCCIACGCCTPLYGIACGCCSQCQMQLATELLHLQCRDLSLSTMPAAHFPSPPSQFPPYHDSVLPCNLCYCLYC